MVGVSEGYEQEVKEAWIDWQIKWDKHGTLFLDENMDLTDRYAQLLSVFITGYKQGEGLDMNEQSDKTTESSEDTIEARAHLAWYKWAKESGVREDNAEDYELMKDAFIDGYLNGFTKRITG